jgi:ABC-2 type transport system permease protein
MTGRMPFWLQVTTLTWRSLVVNFRTPAAIIPPLVLGGFFLLVYEASLGGASGFIPGLRGAAYINFILPLSIVSSALSGAGVAGQSIVRDIENGYFDKLMLTPISRAALVLGPTIGGAIILTIQATFIVTVGMFMGLDPVTGPLGILAVIGMALLLGMSFAGFTIGIALLTGNAAATQSGNFLFFPLTFLTASFVPLNLLQGWLKTAATFNPITYILDGMRSIMLTGWDLEKISYALIACLVMGTLTFAFSLYGLRVRTSRK